MSARGQRSPKSVFDGRGDGSFSGDLSVAFYAGQFARKRDVAIVLPSGDRFRAEAKQLPHRMSEGTERSIGLCLEKFLHRRGFWRSFPRRTKSLGRNAIFLRSVG